MNTTTEADEYADLVARLTRYGLRKYGERPIGIMLLFANGAAHREPFPAAPSACWPGMLPPPQPLAPQPPAGRWGVWASGPDPKHSSDYRLVYWPGLGQFSFGDLQAKAVARLWRAWEEGVPGVVGELVVQAAGATGTLRDLFRSHPAWLHLIVQGPRRGTFMLPAEPPYNRPEPAPDEPYVERDDPGDIAAD